jgi:heme-degrading monooxygenase HmoA
MIVRTWEGRAKPGNEKGYIDFLERIVIPHLRGLPGSLGAQVLRGLEDHSDTFIVQTHWVDLDAVSAFSGPDRDAAVIPDEARLLLAEFDLRARNFEVVCDTTHS